jgi:hypothetical protein
MEITYEMFNDLKNVSVNDVARDLRSAFNLDESYSITEMRLMLAKMANDQSGVPDGHFAAELLFDEKFDLSLPPIVAVKELSQRLYHMGMVNRLDGQAFTGAFVIDVILSNGNGGEKSFRTRYNSFLTALVTTRVKQMEKELGVSGKEIRSMIGEIISMLGGPEKKDSPLDGLNLN